MGISWVTIVMDRLFQEDPCALQLQLCYDEVEACNPLGSKTSVHKLGKLTLTCMAKLFKMQQVVTKFTYSSVTRQVTSLYLQAKVKLMPKGDSRNHLSHIMLPLSMSTVLHTWQHRTKAEV